MALQPALASNAQPALKLVNWQPAMTPSKRQLALQTLSQPALVGYVFAT